MSTSTLGRYGSAKKTPVHFARVPLNRRREIALPICDRIEPCRIATGDDRLWWHAVTARPGRVAHAVRKIREAGLQAYAPMRTHWRESRRGDWRIRKQMQTPLLGSYVFVGVAEGQSLDPLYETDLLGRNRMEVAGIVTNNGRPAPMRCGSIAKLAREEATGWYDDDLRPALEAGATDVVALPAFAEGDSVDILGGPFSSFRGVVTASGDGPAVRIEALIFGQATPVLTPIEWLYNRTRPPVEKNGSIRPSR